VASETPANQAEAGTGAEMVTKKETQKSAKQNCQKGIIRLPSFCFVDFVFLESQRSIVLFARAALQVLVVLGEWKNTIASVVAVIPEYADTKPLPSLRAPPTRPSPNALRAHSPPPLSGR